jgi:hypothetical protein
MGSTRHWANTSFEEGNRGHVPLAGLLPICRQGRWPEGRLAVTGAKSPIPSGMVMWKLDVELPLPS